MSQQIFLLFLVLFVSSAESRRSLYGEPCSQYQRCDRRAWLGCFNETCGCLNPEEMFYEESSNACVSRAGERCKFNIESLDEQPAFELASCVENSTCGADGFCICTEDFVEFPNGTCISTRKYLEPCDSKLQCSFLYGLECSENICRCQNGSKFSPISNHCVGLAGEECIKKNCTENATCDLLTNQCSCEDEYFQDDSQECSPKVGLLTNCKFDMQCSGRYGYPLKCIGGVCSCDPSVSALVRVGQGYPNAACVGKEGSPCILEKCITGALCRSLRLPITRTPRRRAGYSGWNRYEYDYLEETPELTTTPIPNGPENICECQSGYTVSKFNTCGKDFGASCRKNECMEPLVCVTRTCSCRYPHQVYSPGKKMCLGKIRGPCTSNDDCIESSICTHFSNQTYGECACKEGYIQNSKRECDVGYGGDCEQISDCDSIAKLTCIDGKCDCANFAEFSEANRQCLGLVGSDCKYSLISCISNATCGGVNMHSYNDGTCVCDKGFIVSADYHCQLGKNADAEPESVDLQL